METGTIVILRAHVALNLAETSMCCVTGEDDLVGQSAISCCSEPAVPVSLKRFS